MLDLLIGQDFGGSFKIGLAFFCATPKKISNDVFFFLSFEAYEFPWQ